MTFIDADKSPLDEIAEKESDEDPDTSDHEFVDGGDVFPRSALETFPRYQFPFHARFA